MTHVEDLFHKTQVMFEDLKRQQTLLAESVGHAINQLKRLDAIEAHQQAQQQTFEMFVRDAQQHFARLDAFVADTQPRLRTLEAITADTQQRVHKLEDKVEVLTDDLKDLSADSKQRLKRIEMHLQLKGTTRAAALRPTRARATKRHKKI